MRNKKIFFLLISVLIIILFSIFIIVKNFSEKNTNDNATFLEYTPEEEISSKQLRETKVTLFFLDKTSNELKNESRFVDSAILLKNPYEQLVKLLLDGPTLDSLNRVFPENTQLLDADLNKNCVTLNFSKELLNYENEEQKFNIINSLLNTLTQLNEVDSIKIIINGENNTNFNEEYFANYQ